MNHLRHSKARRNHTAQRLSLRELLNRSSARAPSAQLSLALDENLEPGPLLASEKENLLGMLHNSKNSEARCAAAYCIARLGLSEAIPLLESKLKLARSLKVRSMFELAIATLRVRDRLGLNDVTGQDGENEALMDLRVSQNAGERRLATLVMRKIGIQ